MLYVLAGLCASYGLLLGVARALPGTHMLATIVDDLRSMPDTMRRLAWVQFFSWFALFAMWIYTTAAVAGTHFGSTDTQSAAYNEGANWVGVLFGAYNGFAAVAALIIPLMVRAIGLRWSHLINLWLGRAGPDLVAADQGPAVAAAVDGWRRLCLGLDPVPALRAAVGQRAGGEDGRVHGHLQFLHRYPPSITCDAFFFQLFLGEMNKQICDDKYRIIFIFSDGYLHSFSVFGRFNPPWPVAMIETLSMNRS